MRLGLIEALVIVLVQSAGLMYPRRMRLGLIEAHRFSARMKTGRTVSEAHAPRPH